MISDLVFFIDSSNLKAPVCQVSSPRSSPPKGASNGLRTPGRRGVGVGTAATALSRGPAPQVPEEGRGGAHLLDKGVPGQ